MHIWGDEWFKKHGDNLYNAIEFIHKYSRKHHAPIYGKEKWGSFRTEIIGFWNGSIHQILFGYRCYLGRIRDYKSKFINKCVDLFYGFINILDRRLIPIKKTKFGYLYAGISNLNRKIGLVKLVNKYQANIINKTFQLACKKYPDVIDEIISDVDCYKCTKPCKYGDVDGIKIHNKYWKALKENK